MSDLGDVLVTARRAKGLTQEELAHKAGVTQGALSRYESNLRSPDDEVVERLANALDVTPSLLLRGGRLRGAMAVDAHMRRRATAKATVWRQLEAQLNMYRLHAHTLFEEVSLLAEQTIPTFDPFETTPEDAARLTRMQWKLPVGPVRSLIGWLESAGCLVLESDFMTARVDGLSQWVDDHPLVYVNRRSPTDRKRLTLAHELGHLILHSESMTNDPEGEANRFAAEFLMPDEVIRPQLRNLSIGHLSDLKREWMVSMQALIERAYSLGTLRQGDRTNLYKRLTARGWRTNEPLSDQLPQEVARLPEDIGEALLQRGLRASEIDSLAGYVRTTDNPFKAQERGLRAV